MRLKEWKTLDEWRTILNLMKTLPDDVVDRTPALMYFNFGDRTVRPSFIELINDPSLEDYDSNIFIADLLYGTLGRRWNVFSKLYGYEDQSTILTGDLPFNMDMIGVTNIYTTKDTTDKTKDLEHSRDKTDQESAINSDLFIDLNNEKLAGVQKEIDQSIGSKESIQRSMNKIKEELLDGSFDLAYNISVDIVNTITFRLYD